MIPENALFTTAGSIFIIGPGKRRIEQTILEKKSHELCYVSGHVLKFMPPRTDCLKEGMVNSLLLPVSKCLRALIQIQ